MHNHTRTANPLPSTRAHIAARARAAARRIAYNQQVERWEQLLEMEQALEDSTALYFSGAPHPARFQSDFDWLEELIRGGETLSRWMADCVDRLSALQEGK